MARRINIDGRMRLVDYETFSSDETRTIPFSESVALPNDHLQEVVYIVEGVGGEVRGELEITAQARSQNRIKVEVDIRLYEGTSEGTSDLDGERHTSFILYPNEIRSKRYMVYNTDEGDDDLVDIKFTCKNLPA